jgi:urease accessory protein
MSEQTTHQWNLRLWQLISPALPIGAYAYSQGLEYAVEVKWITDETSAQAWILGQVKHTLSHLDIPVLKRLYNAWQNHDQQAVDYWNRFLLASRESAELLAEDRHLGDALARVLAELGIKEAQTQHVAGTSNFAKMFSLGAVRWHIPLEEAAQGYLWTWCENQVAAAIKLVPLGQTAGQRILSEAIKVIPASVRLGLALSDDEIGLLAPGLGIASAKHETQYSRLFRS